MLDSLVEKNNETAAAVAAAAEAAAVTADTVAAAVATDGGTVEGEAALANSERGIVEQSEKDASNSSQLGQPLEEESPKELFKRIADNDSLQNRRLSASVNKLATASTADINKNGRHQMKATRMRFVVCKLGLMSLAISQMSRTILNVSITQMVDPKMVNKKADADNKDSLATTDDSCRWPEDEQQQQHQYQPMSTISSLIENQTKDSFVNYEAATTTTTDLIEQTTTMIVSSNNYISILNDSNQHQQQLKSKSKYEQFEWTMQNQQVLLGGFFYSYFLFMVLGGRLAEIYGAKYVLLLGVAGSAIINLATPWMAHNSFALLVASRILMGAIQSGVFPGVYALINKWLTMSEASIFAPLIKMNLRLGLVLGSLLPGIIDGWPNVFYLTSGLSFFWSLLWLIFATSDPAEHSWVSPGELIRINRKKQPLPVVENWQQKKSGSGGDELVKMNENLDRKKEKGTPWIKLLTSSSVIGLILVKLTFNYALDFLAILLPSYLSYVHHASKETISGITSSMFSIQVWLIVFVGWLAKFVVQKRPFGMSKTRIRKVFQGIASYGLAIGLFIFTFNDCNILFVAYLLQLISILSMFTAGGETMLPYDLSSKYPATIMAIANSVANLSGITTTTLAGFILGDQGGSYKRWNFLIYLIVGANLLGATAFTLLVKAEPIDFSTKTTEAEEGAKGSDINGEMVEMVDIELGASGEKKQETK